MRRDLFIILFVPWLILLIVFSAVPATAYQAAFVPWSGYWWPYSKGGLVTGKGYRGHPAPLEKYDYATDGTYYGPATAYGYAHYYDPSAPYWYGLCFAWAVASIMEKEPVHAGVYNGVMFRVGDKKALLTVLYDGTRYNTYQASDPVEFQNVLETFIKEQEQPIVMDLGSDEEVWNFPVYRYETSYTTEGNVRHYTTTIHFASDMVNPDYRGISSSSRTYYYWFRLSGSEITESGWENTSIDDHPKAAYEPLYTKPRNSGIDPARIRDIADTVDDSHESNNNVQDASFVTTGGYDLLAIDDDWFRVPLRDGDTLYVMPQWEETADMSGEILGPDQEVVAYMAPGGWAAYTARQDGDHYIKVVTSRPDEEYEYTLYLRHVLAHEAIFPVYQPGGWANGVSMSVAGSGSTDERLILCIMGDDGMPVKGSMIEDAAGYTGGILKEGFSMSSPESGYLRIDSDSPVPGMGMEISGTYFAFGADLIPVEDASSMLFFPHYAGTYGIPDQWKTYFGLINTGGKEEDVRFVGHDADGLGVAEDDIVLGPGQKMEVDTGTLSVLTHGTVCMTAHCLSGRDVLVGYIRFSNPNSSRGQALIPLPLKQSSRLMIPHVASGTGLGWKTAFALMNCGDEETEITFGAYNEEGSMEGNRTFSLRPNQRLVATISGIFPSIISRVRSIEIIAGGDIPVCGFSLYSTSDENCLAGQPLFSAGHLPAYMPCSDPEGDWMTGIGLVNAGDTAVDVRLISLDQEGKTVSQHTEHMVPHQHFSAMIQSLFGESTQIKFIRIESDTMADISGVYVMSSKDGKKLLGGVLEFP